MKDKPNEWVSIADLMSGVVAVVILMLILSVIQKNLLQAQREEDKEKSIKGIMATLTQSISSKGFTNLIHVDLDNNKFVIPDNTFARGSACINYLTKIQFDKMSEDLKNILLQEARLSIYIEGHTDNTPVSRPVIDIKKNCAVYDDNYTLSAARAREVRKAIAPSFDSSLNKRLVVAGFGESQPIDKEDLNNSVNRRVEIRFVIPDIDATPSLK